MIKEVISLFRCPQTNKKMIFDETKSCFKVENEKICYPVVEGIIDFISPVSEDYESDKIIKAYDKISKKYDPLITGSTLLSKLIIYLSWGGLHEEYTVKVIDYIPDDFRGILLEVPVGTGVYTVEKYSKLKNATIIAVDFSLEMLKEAKIRFEGENIRNIVYVRSDVGNLPFEDGTIDFLLSMNGFHSFSQKEKAVEEINRILKSGGNFSGCFYVKGRRKISDFIVNASLKRTNLFAPPFYTGEEYIKLFGNYFNFRKKEFCRSFFLFDALKNPPYC